MQMTPPPEGSKPSPDGDSFTVRAGALVHYVVGAAALALALLVVYVFFFEDEAPPFLFDHELSKPQKIEVSGERPVIVIEDIDFGERADQDGETLESKAAVQPADTEAEAEQTAPSAEESPNPEPSADESNQAPPAAEEVAGSDASAENVRNGTVDEPARHPVSAEPAPASGDFVVQIIATRSPKTAERISAKVRDADLSSYIERIEHESQELHRVRAGPFATRGDAEIARRDLQGLGFDDAVVIDLR